MILYSLFFILNTLVSWCYCEAEFSARVRNFSIELNYHTFIKTDGFVLSPYLVHNSLVQIAAGATDNTYKELDTALILPRTIKSLIKGYNDLSTAISDPSTWTATAKVKTKNFFFYSSEDKPNATLLEHLEKSFKVNIMKVDPKKVNWNSIVDSQFEKVGRIASNYIEMKNANERTVILLNVLSFYGEWTLPFDPSNTALELFFGENKEVLGAVNMMSQRGSFSYANIQESQTYAVELPYGSNGKYSLYIFLPYVDVGLITVYSKLATMTIENIVKRISDDAENYALEELLVKVPRFKFTSDLTLHRPLNAMGVYDLFEPDANMTWLVNEKFYVSLLKQKITFEVVEKGSVASGPAMPTIKDSVTPPTFHCNRPFLYFVIEKSTTTILFSGVYSKPVVY